MQTNSVVNAPERRSRAHRMQSRNRIAVEEANSLRELRHVWNFGHAVVIKTTRGSTAVTIVPANTRCPVSADDAGEAIAVALHPGFVRCSTAGVAGPCVQLRCVQGVHDPLIVELVRALKVEIQKQGSAIFAESLATTLAMHLVSKYSCDSSGPSAPMTESGLGRTQLAAVVDYMTEHLDMPVGVARLARIAELSLAHFIRMFKQSTGLSPHQYLLRTRLNRAQELLRRTQHSIPEVARMTGFCGQSHFTKHFRSLLGTTPRRYRQRTLQR